MRIGPNIYKRRDGRWEARVVIGKKANGKPQYKYLYAPTYREVSLAQKDFQKTVCFMIPASEKQKLLFQTAADEWLKQKRKSCKPSTYNKYKNYLDSYILLRWKNTPVGMITQETYDQLFTSLEETLSDSSLRVINTVIKGCLKHALKSVPIDFKSIAATDSQVKILTDSEVSLLLYKLRNRVDLNTVGILFALYTGVRLGELCAVQWKDIDLEQRVCYIRHTLQRIQNPDRKSGEPKTCLHIGLPKNGKERIIPLHDHIVDLLRKIQEKYEPSDYLLSGDFRPTEPRTMENRFKKVLKTCGIREVHFHVLRHTFASQCIESGMDIKALSEILGHSSVKITIDRYVHLTMKFKQNQIMILHFPEKKCAV